MTSMCLRRLWGREGVEEKRRWRVELEEEDGQFVDDFIVGGRVRD